MLPGSDGARRSDGTELHGLHREPGRGFPKMSQGLDPDFRGPDAGQVSFIPPGAVAAWSLWICYSTDFSTVMLTKVLHKHLGFVL